MCVNDKEDLALANKRVEQLEERLALSIEQGNKAICERDAARADVEKLKTSMAKHFADEHLAGDGPEIDRWKTLAKPNQREHDLVRQMRMELLEDDLITKEEYAVLAHEKGAVQRLEDYDVLRARIAALALIADTWRKARESLDYVVLPLKEKSHD